MQLASCGQSDPSIQLSLNVCTCPLWSTGYRRVCRDAFALFQGRRRISSGLSFEFTGLLIFDHSSSNLLNTGDCVAIFLTRIVSFNPCDKPGGEGINSPTFEMRTWVQELSNLLELLQRVGGEEMQAKQRVHSQVSQMIVFLTSVLNLLEECLYYSDFVLLGMASLSH